MLVKVNQLSCFYFLYFFIFKHLSFVFLYSSRQTFITAITLLTFILTDVLQHSPAPVPARAYYPHCEASPQGNNNDYYSYFLLLFLIIKGRGGGRSAEPAYQGVWADNKDFDEVLISKRMLQDHMPDNVLDALEKVSNCVSPSYILFETNL